MVLGADISLTGPGYALVERGKAHLILSQRPRLRGPQRWNEIALFFTQLLDNNPQITSVMFEGYGYASFRLADLAEIGGILRYVCYMQNITYGSVQPSSLKKWFTGDGRADKKRMMGEAFKRGYNCRDHNEADALALALFAEQNGIVKNNS